MAVTNTNKRIRKRFMINKIKALVKNKLLALFNITIRRLIKYILSRKNAVMIFLNDKDFINLMKKINNETELLLAPQEAYQIFTMVKKTAKINGDIAEVGTYKGGSSKLICEAKGNKTLYLFDTFEGLPDLSAADNPEQFYKGAYLASFENVKNYLREYPNVYVYKGLFPETAEPVKNKKFSFLHLDVDIYKSTLDCLKFFYPRMSKGGVIISHDYPAAPGVKKAFDEFFKDKPEPIFELFGCGQCVIIKI